MYNYQFKEGELVKLIPLTNLQKKFNEDRIILKNHPMGKHIDEVWFKPTESNYKKLSEKIYKVDHYQLSQAMGMCCVVTNSKDDTVVRFPEEWLEKV